MKKSILIAFVVVILGLGASAVFLWRGVLPAPAMPGLPLDPANLETRTEAMVAVDDSPCAMKIAQVERAGTCEERWTLLKEGLPQCRDTVVHMSEATFFHEEELVRVVGCFDRDGQAARGTAVLKEALSWGEWKIDHGPTICPGETFVEASIEVREKENPKCLKASDLPDFFEEHLTAGKWDDFLRDSLRSPQVVMVGAWETDTHCVSPARELKSLLTAARRNQGDWMASKGPDDELTYFVGMNPPLDFKLAFTFAEVGDCLALSNIDHKLPEE